MKISRSLSLFIMLMMTAILPVSAQNLEARQMNIYFGSPRKAIETNSQGNTVTEFDTNGRITSIAKGSLKMVYDWSEDGSEVKLSMYQGINYQEHVHVKILENTPSHLRYTIDEITMDAQFKANGATAKGSIINPVNTMCVTYLYHSDDDIFPYAFEQSIGDQSMKMSVTVDETDSLGNPRVYTQEFMGNKEVTRLDIEYY